MTLVEKKAALAEARAAQKTIDQLPPDLQAWNIQYFQVMEWDIAAMEAAAANRARDSPVVFELDWRPILQVAGEVVWPFVKKHLPAASVGAALSAAASYLFKFLIK